MKRIAQFTILSSAIFLSTGGLQAYDRDYTQDWAQTQTQNQTPDQQLSPSKASTETETPSATAPEETNTEAPEVKSSDNSNAEPKISYSLDADGRNWKIKTEAHDDKTSIVEYTPEQVSNDEFQELLTIHTFKNLDITPRGYWELFIQALKKNAPHDKIQSRIIKEDKDSLLGEWWISDNSPNDQHEWIRIFSDGKNLALLRYTTSDLGNVENVRQKWEKILGSATYSK